MKILCAKNRDLRPRSARIKKLKKTDPHYFWKKGVCFLQLFDPSTPKASNGDLTARDYFMRIKNIFLENLT